MKTSYSIAVAALLVALSCSGCGLTPPPSVTGNWIISAKVPNPHVLDQNGNPTFIQVNSWAYLLQEGSSVSGIMTSNFCTAGLPVTFSFSGQLEGNHLMISPIAAFSKEPGTFNFETTVSADLASIQGGAAFGAQRCFSPVLLDLNGQLVPSVAGNWAGTLTSANGQAVNISATIYETWTNPYGFPQLSGNVIFSNSPCYTSGTLTGSQFGTSFSGIINTANGVIEMPQFSGTDSFISSSGQLQFSYSVQGGTCNGDYAQGTLIRQ
jgi:hypothetical protein